MGKKGQERFILLVKALQPYDRPEMGSQLHSTAKTIASSAQPRSTQGTSHLPVAILGAAQASFCSGSRCGAAICPDYFACWQHQPSKSSQLQVPALVFLLSTAVWQLHVPNHLKPGWRSFTHHCVACRVSLDTQVVLVMEA